VSWYLDDFPEIESLSRPIAIQSTDVLLQRWTPVRRRLRGLPRRRHDAGVQQQLLELLSLIAITTD